MRLLDKTAAEFAKGNLPVRAGAVWLVNSRTDGGAAYRIDSQRETCTCEAGMNNKPCWHVAAVQVMELAEKPQTTNLSEPTLGDMIAADEYVLAQERISTGYIDEVSATRWTTAQRGKQWAVVNPKRAGDEVLCSSETDAESLAGVLNGYTAGGEMTRNDTQLIAFGYVFGVASAAKFAEEVESAWISAFIPF